MRQESEPIYLELLEHLSKAPGNWRNSSLCGFVALKGENFSRKLLVVGRAVNGWVTGAWTPEGIRDAKIRQKHIDDMFENKPMTWVTECWGSRGRVEHDTKPYNSKRSAFWRVIRHTVEQLSLANVENPSWPAYIAWSNLYKVSPFEGRNPLGALMTSQFCYCVRILQAEIAVLKPENILFLTGRSWAQPFLAEMGFSQDFPPDGYREMSGTIAGGSRVAVFPHPERKPEGEIVRAIVGYFSQPGYRCSQV